MHQLAVIDCSHHAKLVVTDVTTNLVNETVSLYLNSDEYFVSMDLTIANMLILLYVFLFIKPDILP